MAGIDHRPDRGPGLLFLEISSKQVTAGLTSLGHPD